MTTVLLLTAYLVGSIPFGLWIAKGGWGIDPRSAGSHNIGFTNVYRVVGPVPAVLTLIGDAGKGLGVVLVTSALSLDGHSPLGGSWPFAAGLAAVIGHNYSIFLKGRGGKGVATSFGALFGLNLTAALATLMVWIVTLALTRRVSVASIVGFGTLPIFALKFPFTSSRLFSFCWALLMTALVVVSHRKNLRQLFQGLEPPIR